jgi:hypothetical protein
MSIDTKNDFEILCVDEIINQLSMKTSGFFVKEVNVGETVVSNVRLTPSSILDKHYEVILTFNSGNACVYIRNETQALYEEFFDMAEPQFFEKVVKSIIRMFKTMLEDRNKNLQNIINESQVFIEGYQKILEGKS